MWRVPRSSPAAWREAAHPAGGESGTEGAELQRQRAGEFTDFGTVPEEANGFILAWILRKSGLGGEAGARLP